MQFAKISVLLVSFLLCFVATLSAQKKHSNIKIKGVVKSIEGAKCGYIAKIKTADNKVYLSSIGIPNTDKDGLYRQLIVGETVVVEGETFVMSSENHLTVRNIQPFNSEDNKNFTVKGKVMAIQNEEDGYEAQIQTEGEYSTVFYAVISIANVKNIKNYKHVKVGDTVKVTGELWELQDKARITVRKVH
jgi:hypothetical protein